MKKPTKTPLLTKISYTTAVALACFSGGVATYGLTKFAPGAVWVVAAMGVLFEAGKLTSFAFAHRPLPVTLKAPLLLIGAVLMALNVAGVSGFLSSSYEGRQIGARAASHTSEQTARASASLVERQLAAAESNLAQARTMLIKARDDKGRQRAAQAIVATATAERDALIKQLAAARSTEAKVEGDTISTGGEFAAITFIAAATGSNQDAVVHAVILVIASLPDLLAVLLLVAAGYAKPAPRPRRPAQRKDAAKKGWETRRRNVARAIGPQLVAAE
jgi:hypothetical protein